jgi:AcrR family transcriptional regulator
MSTPTPTKAADLNNRSRLLLAATDAFAEHGYEGASLRAIAHSAGVSFQLITHYFGTKTELWLATVDYLHERYFETGKGLGFKTSGNIQEQFRNHLRLLLTDILQRPQLRRIWIQEYLAGSDRYTNVIKPRIVEFQQTVAIPYYEEVVRLGLVSKYTPEEMSQLFTGIVLTNLVHSHYLELTTGNPVGSAKSIDTQIDLLFRLLTETSDEEAERQHDKVNVSKSAAPTTPKTPDDGDTVVYPWDQARSAEQSQHGRVHQLEAENNQLRQLLANASLENKVLVEMLERERSNSPAHAASGKRD